MTDKPDQEKKLEAEESGRDAQDAPIDHGDDNLPKGEIIVSGHEMPKANVFKLVGLIAFMVITIVICVALWPMLSQVFSEGGVDRVIQQIRDAGPWGVAVLLGLQFLQVVVAFIPGEVVQMAAGILYGPWLGTLLILIGCVISSSFIYKIVHSLGQPFVSAMVPTKYLDKFHAFEQSGKLNSIVFILFLIPGMPKDTFTYLVPLTEMPMKTYLIITTVARIPGVLMSTYAASGLLNGSVTESIVIFVVVAIVAGVAVLFKDKLMALFDRK